MIGVLALVLFLLLILIGGDRGAVAVLALCGNIAVLAFTVILLANGAPPFLVIFAAFMKCLCIKAGLTGGNIFIPDFKLEKTSSEQPLIRCCLHILGSR